MADFTAAQQKGIATLDANLAVSAGAGAGKTRVLVERYINILQQRQVSCDGILAITFTNKAAKEMKERIRKRADALADAAATAEDRNFWREVKSRLESAPIGTFHSFCARILRENPVEAALDPNFAVLDEMESQLIVEKALDEVLEAALAQEELWLDRLLAAYGKPLLVETAPGIFEKLEALGLLADGLAERLTAPYGDAVGRLADIKAGLAECCLELIAFKGNLNKATAQFGKVERLEQAWPETAAAIAAAGGDDDAPYAVLREYLGGLEGRSKDKELVAAIKAGLKALEETRADRAALTLAADWGSLLSAMKAAADRHKAEYRALSFGDLEVRAMNLLQNPAVLRRYSQRIQQIMVDEFQDTNDLQRRMIYLLAGGDAERLGGRKLFVVGDAKQSIYRFRGADVAVFDRVTRDITAAGGEAVELDVNFRSMDGLLLLYNECFSAIMGTADDSVAFQPLKAHRCQPGQGRARSEFVAVDRAVVPEGRSNREAEAEVIAARIRNMVAGGEELINHDAVPRAVQFGDIAVLFRAAKDIDVYAAALQRAGIPYYIVGGRGFYHCQEVRDILNLLKVLDNRLHNAALAGVLRSPMFMLEDRTLMLLKRHGGAIWQGLTECEGIAGLASGQLAAAERARQVMGRLRGVKDNVKISELIRLALDETGYRDFVLTQFMGSQKYANLAKFAAMAVEFEAKGMFTLGDFLRHVARLVEGEAKEGEAQIESEGGDTVKLMTIHKAKGLEFPVVFVPDLHRKFKDETAPVLFSPERGLGLKVPVGDGELQSTSVHRGIAAAEKRLALLELKRVLYVALTRAKDYLVLSAVGDKVSAAKEFGEINNWLGWFGRVCGFDHLAALPQVLQAGAAELRVQSGYCQHQPPLPAGQLQGEALPDGWLAGLVRNIGPVEVGGWRGLQNYSASGINIFRRCPRMFYYQYVAALPPVPSEPEPQPRRGGGLPGHVMGSVLHRCLELLGPNDDWHDCLARVVAEQVPDELREAALAQGAPLLRRYMDSALNRESALLPVRKEWRFVYRLPDEGGGYDFTGSIDCLLEYGDGSLGIIDYKTDAVTVEKAGEKAKDYWLQLVLYALAAEAALGRAVKEARLYFLRPDSLVTVPLDTAARTAAMAEMAAVCRHVAAHGAEADYTCNRQWCSRCDYRVICPGK